ncbi:MAG: hypothetical protein HYY06_28440 [Deltaproteobacteria bacterium]|nr:hypothetical protein [Deltaproteobacteria bacterium]
MHPSKARVCPLICLFALLPACGADESEASLYAADPPAEEVYDAGASVDLADAGDYDPDPDQTADAGADAATDAATVDAGAAGEDSGEEVCACAEGAKRYCEQAQYCAWGVQECEVRQGIRFWGTCWETYIPPGCEPGGSDAETYQWSYAGGYWDGRVDDPDGDGVLTSEPDWWLNPAGQDCALRSGSCVQDVWDFDLDGDTGESMGDCEDIEECA